MSRLTDFLWGVLLLDWPKTVCVFILAKLPQIYLVKFFLFSLLLNFLILLQQFFTVVIIILFSRLRMNPWVFFIRISVRFNKLSRIGIFRKRIISEIDKSFLTDFYFLMHSRFIVADKINIVTINIRTFSVTELFFFNNLYLSVFFSTDLSLSFQQFRLEILLSQLIESSLPYFPVF